MHAAVPTDTSFLVTIADDVMVEYTPPRASGFLHIARDHTSASVNTAASCIIAYCTTTTAMCVLTAGSVAGVAVQTTALASEATTGTDARLNVSSVLATGKVQIKNRLGSSITLLCRWA